MDTNLYHFTSFENLQKILKAKAFYPRFCLEKYHLDNICYCAHAMVCFADLLPSEVEARLKNPQNGRECCISLSKDWAINNMLSPVIYYDRNSSMERICNNIVKKACEVDRDSDSLFFNSSFLMIAFMKQYRGHYMNKKTGKWSDDEVEFYTEREWRYIPFVENEAAYYLTREEYENHEKKQCYEQNLIPTYALKFEPSDIREIRIQDTPHTKVDDLLNALGPSKDIIIKKYKSNYE